MDIQVFKLGESILHMEVTTRDLDLLTVPMAISGNSTVFLPSFKVYNHLHLIIILLALNWNRLLVLLLSLIHI